MYVQTTVSKVYVRALTFYFFLQCIVFVIFKKEDQIEDTFEEFSRGY